jgi:hypothetical protein
MVIEVNNYTLNKIDFKVVNLKKEDSSSSVIDFVFVILTTFAVLNTDLKFKNYLFERKFNIYAL